MMDKPKCILSDLDGTLALRTEARPDPYFMETVGLDVPNTPVVKLLRTLQEAHPGAATFIMTAREQQWFDHPEEKHATSTWHESARWLNTHDIHWLDMFMRDNKDNRPDEIIKREKYERHIEPFYDVVCVLDDRRKVVTMWRELGLFCLAVDEGDF
jgi:hypothetical protein